MITADLLKRIPLFAGIPDDERASLAARAADVRLNANEWLILGALTPIAYWLARRYPIRPPIIGRNLLAHAGGALLLCIGWATAGASLRWVLGIRPNGDHASPAPHQLAPHDYPVGHVHVLHHARLRARVRLFRRGQTA